MHGYMVKCSHCRDKTNEVISLTGASGKEFGHPRKIPLSGITGQAGYQVVVEPNILVS
jgi:hypothetical protein